MIWISGRPDGHTLGELAGSDGVRIPYREWHRPDARAVICYLHGQGDHSGPFTAMGDILYESGLSVYAHDHRGFGRSQARRGHIDDYGHFIDDALAMLELAGRRNAGRPVFLLGLSMGGHVALRTAARAGNRVRGVVALSPGFRLRRTPWREVVRWSWRLLWQPDRPLPAVTRLAPTTRNPVHLLRSAEDEYWVREYTPRFYLATLRSLRQAYREMPRVQVPVLVLMAGEDRLVCPRAARRYFDRIGARDKGFQVLPHLYHNLVAEPEMPQVAAMIIRWIASWAPGSA